MRCEMGGTATSVHPIGRWRSVATRLWGGHGGDKLGLVFTDESGTAFALNIHYNGDKKEAARLLLMIREALATLPETKRCDCEPNCTQIILSRELDNT